MKRILINTFKNIRRSPYQSIAAVLILTLTLFTAQIFILLSLGSNKVLEYFETRPQVTAFFKDDSSESDILSLKQSLEQTNYVAGVTYISKDAALEIYRQQNADDPLLLEMVTSDILPASIEVSAVSVDQLPQIKKDLESSVGVEEVIYQEDIINSLKSWTTGIRLSGIVLVLTLLFTSLLVITIIISIKASSKRQEIATMRLLGATRLFIYGPFMIEGVFYGLVGALIAWTLTYIVLLYSTPFLIDFLGDIPILPVNPMHMLAMYGITAAAASFMGMLAGLASSRRFGS
jgi:cell division transport system permease protein